MSLSDEEFKKAEAELHGTTLRIYWHLFKSNRPVGVREMQRAVGLSSPSTALHHLEKLRELGLVKKDEYGQYNIVEQVKVGTLRLFFRFGKLVLPRYLFYAVFFTTALVFYVVESFRSFSFPNMMAIIFGLSAGLISWYEAIRIWKEKLF